MAVPGPRRHSAHVRVGVRAAAAEDTAGGAEGRRVVIVGGGWAGRHQRCLGAWGLCT